MEDFRLRDHQVRGGVASTGGALPERELAPLPRHTETANHKPPKRPKACHLPPLRSLLVYSLPMRLGLAKVAELRICTHTVALPIPNGAFDKALSAVGTVTIARGAATWYKIISHWGVAGG